ncbi:hypothetical protein ASG33_24710 [Dyadobacter sp. Leaf189]|nr:hypothetical protein ASG33_24710 [Dyadobacter sp. Leaf189]
MKAKLGILTVFMIVRQANLHIPTSWKEKRTVIQQVPVKWETLIPRYPKGRLLFIVYHADSAIRYIDKYGCDSLGKRHDLVLKRFEVTVDYLKKNNWTLTYP